MYYAIYCATGWLIQSNCQTQFVPSYHGITDITSLSIFVGFLVIADHCYLGKATYLYRDVSFSINLTVYLHFPNFYFFKK